LVEDSQNTIKNKSNTTKTQNQSSDKTKQLRGNIEYIHVLNI